MDVSKKKRKLKCYLMTSSPEGGFRMNWNEHPESRQAKNKKMREEAMGTAKPKKEPKKA